MADGDERLVVSLEARIRDFEKNFERAQKTANARFTAIENRAKQARRNLEGAFSASTSKLALLAGSYLGTRELLAYSDGWTRATNALKVAGLEGGELTSTLDALYGAAQRQGAPLEALTTLFGRAAQSAKDLGATRSELIQFSEDVATALRVAGTSPEEATGALLQLSQALGSARVQAEEFNSINEGARPILQAVANGIEEAGGSVSKLKILVNDGKISNVAFFRGFQAGVQTIRDQAATAEPTISAAFTRVQNAMMKLVGEVDRAGGFSKSLVSELSDMAAGFEKAKEPILAVVNLLQKLVDLQNYVSSNGLNLGTKLNQLLFGVDKLEDFITNPPKAAASASRSGGIGSDPDRNYVAPAAAKPIKAADFPVVGAKGAKERLDEYQRLVKAMNESTAALNLEAEMTGRGTYEMERARAEQELLNAAKEAGKTITADVVTQINREADAHANAVVALEQARKKQQQLESLQQEIGNAAISGIEGLIDGTKTLNDVLSDTLKRLADLMLQAVLLGEGPLGSMFGGGSGGLVGGMFKAFGFADGGVMTPQGPRKLERFASGGVSRKAAIFGEAGPEAAVPLPDGRRIPVEMRVPETRQSAGMVTNATSNVTLSPTVSPTYNIATGQNSQMGKEDWRSVLSAQNKSLERVIGQILLADFENMGPVAKAVKARYGLNEMRGAT